MINLIFPKLRYGCTIIKIQKYHEIEYHQRIFLLYRTKNFSTVDYNQNNFALSF